MNELTLPPSPNWYSSSILACANDGTIAWGSKNSIIIAKAEEIDKQLKYSIIEKVHSERVSTIVFSPKTNKTNDLFLVSGGNDNLVKIWNLSNLSLHLTNNQLKENQKIVAVDWSKHNSNLICFTSELGLLITWNIDYNISQFITLGKVTPTCLACCPHDSNIVSVGFKNGSIYIINVSGSGNIKYKLRGHDMEVVSLSWCPIPINIFDEKEKKEFLLASGAKDRVIFLWRAGSDGRYEAQITLPVSPLDSNHHKSKIVTSRNFITVHWLTSTLLFTSSVWGELLMWNLTGKTKKKFNPTLIHAKHSKGLFSIAGLSEKSDDKFENNVNENWRLEYNNVKAIWTVAQDRQVICCSILKKDPVIEYVIPTLGGFVYCMSASPLDTSQIAYGSGDYWIRLWNLSEEHTNTIELQIFWEKIAGTVRSLSWHPEKENILAFATNEGRVGTFDTNTKKPPTIYRQYHRHIIYRIGWGPAENIKDYVLYTCGDGELVYYNPDKYNDVPISVIKRKDCTDFCWKPDYSLLAIGFEDGSISFLNRDLSPYGHTIHSLNKAVQCIVWHPECTISDLSISAMQNYLAVSVNSTEITIFEIFNSESNNSEEITKNKSSFYKVIATLRGHSDKVVCLAWSPHFSGYLVSGSYDNTAQVWQIETQEIIATYTNHLGSIQCCMWSPFYHDLIITGSVDFTLRIWSISNQKVLMPPPVQTTSIKNRQRTKKKKTFTKNILENVLQSEKEKENNQLKMTMENDNITGNSLQISNETNDLNQYNYKMLKKKKPKKITRFPRYAEISNCNKSWCLSIQQLLDSLKINGYRNENESNCNGTENISSIEEKTLKLNENNYVLFGTKNNLEDSLKQEKKLLNFNGHYSIVTEIDLWTDNLKENLYEAKRNKRLSDYLVSLAPSVSIETWKIMCEAYATQLIFEENPHKAVTYFLCINKINEAINVFLTEKLYKEAYSLASSKLNSKDPIIVNILNEWASNAQNDGHFQNAIECYIKLGEYTKAAKFLERRKDFYSLLLAIHVAELGQNIDLSETLADKAILQSLLQYNVENAKSVIEKYPQMQYREVEVQIFNELNSIFKNINDETIFNWLKGLSDISILEALNENFTKCPKKYSLLLQKDVFPLATNETMVQISVNHQLALTVLSDQKEQQIEHIVKALNIISQYEKINFTSTDNVSLLIKYILVLDKKNMENVDSIFNYDETVVAESLRAYLCFAIIKWFQESNLNENQLSECKNYIIKILKKCIKDLLHKDTFMYWNISSEINKLESQLHTSMGKLQDFQEDSVDSTEVAIERLDQLKLVKKQFLDQRISAPNPFLSYAAVMNFISKISDVEIRDKTNELVSNTWKNAML